LSISSTSVRHISETGNEQSGGGDDKTAQHFRTSNQSQEESWLDWGYTFCLEIWPGMRPSCGTCSPLPTADALGLPPSVALAASQAAQAYDLDQHRFLDSLLQLLPSFWPLLLVIAGIILLRDTLADKVKELPAPDHYFKNKYFQNKDTGCRFRCASFDA
jgi:hypothetical protein